MWDDVIIGRGNRGMSAMCWGCLEDATKASISENKMCYWITNCFLDVGMTVFKNTPEAEHLAGLITEGSAKKVDNYLDTLVVKNASPSKLKRFIKRSQRAAFDTGQKHAQVQVRQALGMER